MKNSIVAAVVTALIMIGCDDAPTTSTSHDPMIKPPQSGPAVPALTYQGTVSSRGSSYRTVAVMNADGSRQAHLYGAGQPAGQYFMDPSWSPTGASICFAQTNGSTTAPVAAIRAIDVSVNSSGVAVGSNARTIYTVPAGHGVGRLPAWSSTTTMGKIAFTTYNPSNSVRTLWVIPQTGGTPIKVWETDATYVKENGSVIGHAQALNSTTWSPDDHKLAVVRQDSATTATPYAVSTIMIFSTSDNGTTWSYIDSIKVPGSGNMSVRGMEWSRNAGGIDRLAYDNAGNSRLYYVNPTTGAVPTTNGVQGAFPTWAPDNSSLIFHNLAGSSNGYLSRVAAFTSSVTNVVVNPADGSYPVVRWKR